MKKIAKPGYLAGHCGESNGIFETLLKLAYWAVNDSCGNIAGCYSIFLLSTSFIERI